MSSFALALVLFAAVMHASWNAMVRGGGDRGLVLAGIAATHALAGLAIIAVVPAPRVESWPYLITSALVHYVYYWLLFRAYREGDLSQVYPISRGLSPALVTLGAMALIGETLPPLGLAGVALISSGIGLLAFSSRRKGRAPMWFAVALGLTIALYSVADGIGIRSSGSVLGYIGWLYLAEAVVPAVVVGRRWATRVTMAPRVLAISIAGGVLSFTAYGIVLYAKTIAPIGAVSAVRESSVIIAALIGVFVFGERPAGMRLLAAVVVAAGVVALASSS
ncbi:MAG: hypothetical protein GC150_07120 [Rhizobiales bacterium]|nr:hypothetical protein [Hyphomicrobiales bacterium]